MHRIWTTDSTVPFLIEVMIAHRPNSSFVACQLQLRLTPGRLFTTWVALAAAANSLAATHYVDLNSLNPTPPYTNWATAATVIQDAVDAAAAREEVVVTNGTYASGGWSPGYESNRVAVLKALTIRSVNGPGLTVIDGAGSMRCVYLTAGASISGFTFRNGFVGKTAGAGVFCEGPTAVVSNCVIVSNSVYGFDYGLAPYSGAGGGAYGGTLNNCALIGNSAHGYSYIGLEIFLAAGLGGGAANCSLSNCVLIGNSAYAALGDHADAPGLGGGAADCSLNNCLLIGNYADDAGGGAALVWGYPGDFYGDGMLNNCTVSGNSANYGGGVYGGGALNNSIVYFNTAAVAGANYDPDSTLNYCCTTPMPTNGVGNITNAPLFVDLAGGNLGLQSNSPCIDAGSNDYVTTASDLDGNPGILGGTVDIGAYEFASPKLLVEYLIGLVNQSSLSTKPPLLASLQAVLSSLRRGNTVSAVNQLRAFQNKVRAQVEPLDSALADQLNRLAQHIARALDAEKGATR